MQRTAGSMRSTGLATLLVAALGLSSCGAGNDGVAPPSPAASPHRDVSRAAMQRDVVVNGIPVPAARLDDLQRHLHLRIEDGRYWYDRRSGAMGPDGGPTLAFIVPDLELGGPLAADASAGTTGVFLNGRELPQYDLIELTRLVGFVAQGRYFLDASGNAGFEGGPPMINLVAASRQHGPVRGGWYATAAATGEPGRNAYVVGRDATGRPWGEND
jgi:hypothetical protein